MHASLPACLEVLDVASTDGRVFAITTKGAVPYHEPAYQSGDILLFGPETRGLPDEVLSDPGITARIRIPMRQGSRSLNLSNAVAILTYEVLRQLDYPDLT